MSILYIQSGQIVDTVFYRPYSTSVSVPKLAYGLNSCAVRVSIRVTKALHRCVYDLAKRLSTFTHFVCQRFWVQAGEPRVSHGV